MNDRKLFVELRAAVDLSVDSFTLGSSQQATTKHVEEHKCDISITYYRRM